MNDPLEPLPDEVLPRPEFREILRDHTTLVLRSRRRARRVAWFATAAACVALVTLVIGWWRSSEMDLDGIVVGNLFVPKHGPDQPQPPGPTEDKPKSPMHAAVPLPTGPVLCELQAFDSPPPARAERYLDAGNRYLEETQDYASALRCYEQALGAGGPTQEISSDDNWLVMALKMDQKRREN
jgi:hypothetical protein